MHSVLNLQTERADAEDDKSLEQRLGQAGPGRLLAHDDWSELAVITDQDQLRESEGEKLQNGVIRSRPPVP